MRATLIALLLVACQGDPSTVNERALNHSMNDRAGAMKALSAGLDDAYLWLKDHPKDQAGALAKAKAQIGKFYTPEETDGFRLHSGTGEVVLYLQPGADHVTLWLGRTDSHLIVEPSGLSPEARAKVGVK